MKKRRTVFAYLLMLFLVAVIGLVSATILPAPECDCWGGCYYCEPMEDKCRTYDGPGACFCHDKDGCDLVERRFCCAVY